MTLSPDGKSVAYIAPTQGQGSVLVTMRLDGTATPKTALIADGKPARLEHCGWVSSDRLVCLLYALVKDPATSLSFLPVTRQLAVNADGSNLREFSNRLNSYSRGYNLHGGSIIDWLPDEDGSVLMTRSYLPDDHTGTTWEAPRKGSEWTTLTPARSRSHTSSHRIRTPSNITPTDMARFGSWACG